jgi:hypothetical protein
MAILALGVWQMSEKSWHDLALDEKVEDLRKDIIRLFEAINSTNGNLRQAEKGLSEIFTRVQKLEKKG